MSENRYRRLVSARPVTLTSRVLIGFVAVFLLAGCGGDKPIHGDGGTVELPRPVGPEPTPENGIRPGEMLDVFVIEDPTFNGSYQVRSEGHIIVPKLGRRVRLGGMSLTSAENTLKRELEKTHLNVATVIIDRPGEIGAETAAAEGSGIQVFLRGKVSRPGRYTVAPVGERPPTVLEAILQAGGPSRFAYKKKAYILRRTSDGRLSRIDTDLLAIESGRAKDVPIATGDIIVVPEKKWDVGL